MAPSGRLPRCLTIHRPCRPQPARRSVAHHDPVDARAEALAVRNGRIVAVGNEGKSAATSAPARASWTRRWDGGTRLPGRPHPPDRGRARALQCNLHELRGCTPTSTSSPSTRRAIPTWNGSRAAAGRWTTFPGGTPRRGPRPRHPGPAGLPSEPRRARGLGEHAHPRARRHHGSNPRPRQRPDRARPGRFADGNPARGCRGARGTAHPARHRRGPLLVEHAQRELHPLGITAWQDAWVLPPDDRGLSPRRGKPD